MSAFKYVPVPPDAMQNGIAISFEMLVTLLLNDPKANASRKALFAAERIEQEVKGKRPGDVVRFHPDDHRLLDEICEAPTSGEYPALFGVDGEGKSVKVPLSRSTLLPTLSAIAKATDDAPHEPALASLSVA